ncbi:MAG: RNA polymerase sigma factor [Ardenticatenaceae bacterium]
MVFKFVLPKEKEFQVEGEEARDATPSSGNQADEGADHVALSHDASRSGACGRNISTILNGFKLTGNQQDAEDGLAEVMLQAWAAWEQREEITNLKGWLFRVSSNLSLNMQLKNQIRSCYI